MLEIKEIPTGRNHFIDLLLIGDEQESMIARYLDRGDMFVLYNQGELCGACVVTDEGGGVCELKNIAVYPQHQGRGYGRALVEYITARYKGLFAEMIVGTGEVPGILAFYDKCGFRFSHRVADFFTGHYDHPIVEEGIVLRDMVYLKKEV